MIRKWSVQLWREFWRAIGNCKQHSIHHLPSTCFWSFWELWFILTTQSNNRILSWVHHSYFLFALINNKIATNKTIYGWGFAAGYVRVIIIMITSNNATCNNFLGIINWEILQGPNSLTSIWFCWKDWQSIHSQWMLLCFTLYEHNLYHFVLLLITSIS